MLRRALVQLRPSKESLSELSSYVEARKRVEKARAVRTFRFHALAYVLGNAFLGGWNALAYVGRDDQILWFYLPLIF